MSGYRGFSAEELEEQYDLVKRRSNFSAAIAAQWEKRSEEFRRTAGARIDLSFGEDERDLLDLFPAASENGPVLAFIHGGYWQRGTKEMYSFIAEPFVASGVAVAVLEYNLCPSVRMSEIAPQVRRALIWLWRNADVFGFSADKVFLMGASAGAHLTAMMLSTDWTAESEDLPPDLIKAAIPVSGIYDLEPIRQSSINDALHMDVAEARRLSPVFMDQPTNTPQLVVVGGTETEEFHRQSDEYCARFGSGERDIERYSEPGVDHFDVLNRLTDRDSEFFKKMMQLIASSTSS